MVWEFQGWVLSVQNRFWTGQWTKPGFNRLKPDKTGQNWTKPNRNCKSLQWVRNSLGWKESEDNEWIFLLAPVYYHTNYILYSIYHGRYEQQLDKTWTKLGQNLYTNSDFRLTIVY